MARALWTGSISFGLVTIPVGLYSATEDHSVHFNQFQRGTADRIRYQRINERTGKEVDYADIVKGHEVGVGEFVIVEPDELSAIEPGRSRSIEITSFVDLNDIDPIFFQKTYWLAPAKPDYAHSYSLLTQAMAKTNKVGIATFVMRGKQYLTGVRAENNVLALDTFYFADEIRDPYASIETLPEPEKQQGKELTMAVNLIESMSGPWVPEDYKDTYTAEVKKLIENKRKGNKIVTESAPPEATEVVDLMEALRRSVEGARSKQRTPKTASGKSKKAS